MNTKTKQELASDLQDHFLQIGREDFPRRRMPKKVLTDGGAPVGHHAVMNEDGKAIAVFKGRKKKDGTIEVLAAPIKRQITLKHGKDYSGRIGGKTQAKRDAYLALHPEDKS